MSKYTARVKVAFTVEYILAIPTDSPNPSDADILGKICGKDIFTDVGWSASGGRETFFALNDQILEQEGIHTEGFICYGDPIATGNEHVTRDWDITVDRNE